LKKPDTPLDEETRLKTLRSLNILDTPAEERFDRLTRLAKRMFNVPIALVSLVDENRQWFKSCLGLEASETPRDISFCGHAILNNEIFIVSDATKDDRFADNPLVLGEPLIRFYAGCPLRYIDGSRLGTLCVIDLIPRTLSLDDLEAFKDLAELVERELAAVELAKMDELTKISNRRGFITLAQNRLDLCARQGIPASLIFLDLDKFKHINDNFGHAEGDKVLIAFAEKMKRVFRSSDAISRLGGDEFAVLLINATKEQASYAIARLRNTIENYNQETNCGYNVLFSEGIVTLEFNQDSLKEDQRFSIEVLLNQADSLMYKKKNKLSTAA
jgi:diguanylate cyclase (GGDEF)-like protein